MSNIEVFNKIFNEISNKIIDQHFVQLDSIKYRNKNRYFTNIKVNEIISSLNNNINLISVYLINSLYIRDEDSVVKLLDEHINSNHFKYSLKVFERPIDSVRKVNKNDISEKYKSHLYYFLIGNNLREKIMALSSEISFQKWTKRRWKIVLTGYVVVILILLITYYVFVSK